MKATDVALILAVSGVVTLNSYATGALTIALPAIGKSLGFSQADLQWPLTVTNLTNGCLLLFFGRVSDIVGARPLFLVGSTIVGASSLAAPFSPSPLVFIICEALLGVGSAISTPAAIGLLVHHFPPGPSRSRALGIMGAFQPIGWIMGLVIGGLLTGSKATWHSLFYIQTGLAFLFGSLGYAVFKVDQNVSRRYTKGLDWGGAFLSTAGIAMLTYSLADSTTAMKGWGTPRVPGILSASLVILALFLYYEHRREVRSLAVLMPLSMWRNSKAKLPAVMLMVFFGWFSFNCLIYWMTLYFEQVLLLSPITTAVRLLPMVASGISTNIIGGYFVNRLPSSILLVAGLLGNVASPLIFALIDLKVSYWAMAFIVMVLNAGADVAFPIVSLHLSHSFDQDSQSLAAGLFTVSIRLATALGMAITSTVANEASKRFHLARPDLLDSSPEVLMVGYRAAGWTCFAAGSIAVLTVLIGLRDLGIVGLRKAQEVEEPKEVEAVTGAAMEMDTMAEASGSRTSKSGTEKA